ncbi:MAG: BlaI/MecI/CopY family transcriptional regulator [bacterium]|nr:BlaI/MecI/CopY family transcriptional regulator [bacterium]
MNRTVKTLGDLEKLVMQIVWSQGCVKVRCVYDKIKCNRKIAYTTVMTTMDRLEKKKILKRVKVGKAYEYRAVNDQVQLNKKMSRAIIESLINNYGNLAIAQFVDMVDKIDPKMIEKLRDEQNQK